MEARQGTFIFDIDQTYCRQQGKLTENTIIRGQKTKRPKKSKGKNKRKKYAQRSSHCFVMGLLITPSGIRLPFSVSYYTEAYCKAKKIAYRKQTELAAQLIRQLPLPPEARVVVLGDTAFDAKAIRTACAERKFSWIVPINPERVLAGEKPRPKVSSLSEDLTADQMVCLALPFFGASIPGFVGLLTGRGPFSPAFALIPGRSESTMSRRSQAISAASCWTPPARPTRLKA